MGEDPTTTGASAFRFDVTLYNPSPDAVTTISVAPITDQSGVSFSSSMESFFALNSGERQPLAIHSNLENRTNVAAFQWRMCWTYVMTEDWYAAGMYDKSAESSEFEIFIERHKAQVCDAWRPWTPDR